MIVKISTLVNSTIALNKLINQPMPVLSAWQLKRNVKVISGVIEPFNELQNELIKKYAVSQISNEDHSITDTNEFKVLPENLEAYLSELTPLWEKEEDLPTLVKLKFKDFPKAELSANDLTLLEYLLDEE